MFIYFKEYVLKFCCFGACSYSWGYRKVYEQFSYALQQKYPDLHIVGDNYPPGPLRATSSQILGFAKLILIGLVVSGQNPFAWLNMNTPNYWTWATDNKVKVCYMKKGRGNVT